VGTQTKKNLSLLFAAVAVAALTILYIWRVNREPEDIPEETPAPVAAPLSLANRAQAEVARIYVTTGEGTLLFLPGDDVFGQFTWYLAEDPDLLLDRAQVQHKLRPAFSLNANDRIHEDTGGLQLADFGLDPPLLTLSAHKYDGGVATLRLGSPTPDQTRYFIMADGDPAIYVIPRLTAERMLLRPEELLDRSLPSVVSEQITYFRLAQRGRDTMELVHDPDLEISETMATLGITPLTVVLPGAIAGREADNFILTRQALEPFDEEFRLGEVAAMYPDDLAPFGLDDPFIDFHFISEQGELHLLFGSFFVREVNGASVNHIYVKLADRPHVFMAESAPVTHITDLNMMQFITRFVALVPIVEVERVTVTHTLPERNLDIVINHDPAEGSNTIFPTINGYAIPEAPFRVLYRMLIGIGADAYREPFRPEGEPVFTVIYHMLDGTETVIGFFYFDENFFSFSVDGDYAWAVTNRRSVDVFFNEAAARMEAAGLSR
jgi:hypothetical protein